MQNTNMYGSTGGTATNTAQDTASRASEKLNNLGDTAQQTVERLTNAASQAASRLSAKGEELWAMRGDATETARTYMRDHPVATIGIAVAIGIVLSKLLSRR
jgi:ElaB/YqjD/DUF883 family membrane-anchored ribosome-binding protein